MPTFSLHIINQFYVAFSNREIAFNRSIINYTGLEPKKVFLKIKGEQSSCILYSCSMKSAKVIMYLDQKSFELLKNANNCVNLRLSFLPKDIKNSIVFFIPAHVESYKLFSKDNNSFILNLNFTQKPPDDLIEIIGKIIKEKENFEKRKDIRISLDGRVPADMGLVSNQGVILIDNLKRQCIIRNISANGTLILLACLPKLVLNKDVIFTIFLQHNKEPVSIEGKIIRADEIAGRKDIYGIAVQFYSEKMPMTYQRIINSYLEKLENLAKHSR